MDNRIHGSKMHELCLYDGQSTDTLLIVSGGIKACISVTDVERLPQPSSMNARIRTTSMHFPLFT